MSIAVKIYVLDHGGDYEWILASSPEEAIRFYKDGVIGQDSWDDLVADHCGHETQFCTYEEFLEGFIREESMDRMVRWNIEEDENGELIERPFREHIISAFIQNKEFPMYFGSTYH